MNKISILVAGVALAGLVAALASLTQYQQATVSLAAESKQNRQLLFAALNDMQAVRERCGSACDNIGTQHLALAKQQRQIPST
ncbi:MAG: hypothetical protein ACK5HY_01310 [Parahaliea sp.]